MGFEFYRELIVKDGLLCPNWVNSKFVTKLLFCYYDWKEYSKEFEMELENNNRNIVVDYDIDLFNFSISKNLELYIANFHLDIFGAKFVLGRGFAFFHSSQCDYSLFCMRKNAKYIDASTVNSNFYERTKKFNKTNGWYQAIADAYNVPYAVKKIIGPYDERILC